MRSPSHCRTRALFLWPATGALLLSGHCAGSGKPARPAAFLLVPNHITWVDALIPAAGLPTSNPLRHRPGILSQADLASDPARDWLHPHQQRQSHAAVRAAAEKIAEGEIVCVFPKARLERRGRCCVLQRGYEVIARHAEGSGRSGLARSTLGIDLFIPGREIFQGNSPSESGTRLRWPLENHSRQKQPTSASVREELLKLGEFCFSRRPSLDRHLAEDCVRGLKRRPLATAVVDGTDHTQLSRGKLLGAAAAFSRFFAKGIS